MWYRGTGPGRSGGGLLLLWTVDDASVFLPAVRGACDRPNVAWGTVGPLEVLEGTGGDWRGLRVLWVLGLGA